MVLKIHGVIKKIDKKLTNSISNSNSMNSFFESNYAQFEPELQI